MLTIDVKLIFDSPLHIGNGREEQPRPLMRDARGRYYVRSAAIKGLHRTASRHMASGLGLTICEAGCYPLDGKKPCIVCQLFGSTWVEGRLYYRDLLVSATPTPETAVISRSAQHRQRCVRRSSTQYELETLPAGTTFSGQIDYLIADRAQLGLALAALRSIQTVGAANAVGYGLCRVEAFAFDKNKSRLNEQDLASALGKLRPRTP
jgi:CRISPR/Cas system CSM-associated protein Csm3 (group 7 of RAMP superfamily)